MGIIPDEIITKEKGQTNSFYHYLVSRFMAPYFTFLFKKCKFINPGHVTLISFVLILFSSCMVLDISMLSSTVYRVAIAVLIQLGFIFDCCDGQLARITGTSSKMGAWLDKILDRIGEVTIYSIFGYAAWQLSGNKLFFMLGIVTGYGLSAFTLVMVLSDSVLLQSAIFVSRIKKNANGERSKQSDKKKFSDTKFAVILSRMFFFLDFGIGERYLYLSFFIIIKRLDIMLYITAFLAVLRVLSISYYVGHKLKETDTMLKGLDE